MSTRTPTVWTDHLFDPTQQAMIRLDTPAWWAWLAAPTTTRFALPLVDPLLGAVVAHLTVRKEHRQRGGVYWTAYRRQHNRVQKVYLGRTTLLTQARLVTLATSWPSPAPPVDARKEECPDRTCPATPQRV